MVQLNKAAKELSRTHATMPLMNCARIWYWTNWESGNLIGRNPGLSFVYLQNLLRSLINVCANIIVIWNRKFITAQWSTDNTSCFNYLPKFTIFGKYVRLSVCYLPKFTILASMFVCPFVCLSVRFVKHNSWTLWHIITKLGPHMEWVSSSSMWHWQIIRSWN